MPPPPNPMRSLLKGQASAGRAINDRWLERAARAGLLSRATNYLVLALLVGLIAVGHGQQEADRKGAVQAVAAAPFGKLLLIVLCLGFTGFIIWQVLRAVVRRGDQGDAGNTGRRLLAVGTALLYLTFLFTTLEVLLGSSSSSPESDQQSWTARLLGSGAGRVAVAAAGVTLIVAGLVLLGYAISRKFEKLLDTGSMSRPMRQTTAVLGLLGQGARGVVIVIIGGFVLAAAVSRDASKSKGMDASLHTLAGQPYGTLMLAVVALGFLAFGLYSLIDARYRDDFSR